MYVCLKVWEVTWWRYRLVVFPRLSTRWVDLVTSFQTPPTPIMALTAPSSVEASGESRDDDDDDDVVVYRSTRSNGACASIHSSARFSHLPLRDRRAESWTHHPVPPLLCRLHHLRSLTGQSICLSFHMSLICHLSIHQGLSISLLMSVCQFITSVNDL